MNVRLHTLSAIKVLQHFISKDLSITNKIHEMKLIVNSTKQ